MSYILDALRKSEQQRLQGKAPLLVTTQLSPSEKKQSAFLLYGLLAFTLISAGVLIGWLQPWQHNETKPNQDVAALTTPVAAAPQIAYKPAPQLELLPPKPEKAKELEPTVSTLRAQKPTPTIKLVPKADDRVRTTPVDAVAQSSQQPASKVPEQIPQETAKPAIEKATSTSTSTSSSALPEPNIANGANSEDDPAQAQKIVAISALPVSIQQEIPAMSISGYAYSTIAKERSVGINDRLLQEGEYLAPGLKLEQIREDGLIFSYKKYLFHHSL